MGKGDNRLTRKMRRKKNQRKKKRSLLAKTQKTTISPKKDKRKEK